MEKHIMTDRSKLAQKLKANLRLPVMAGPMFIAATADLVIEQCRAGIIGSMPALNPRTTEQLDADIARAAGATIVEVNPDRTAISDAADLRLGGRSGELLPRLAARLSSEPSPTWAIACPDFIKKPMTTTCRTTGSTG